MRWILLLAMAASPALARNAKEEPADPRLVRIYAEALAAGSLRLRYEALRALQRGIEAPLARALVGRVSLLLADKHPILRREALVTLAALRVKEIVPRLVKALSHPDARIRFEALGALGTWGTLAEIDAVRKLLADRVPFVRQRVLDTVQRIVVRQQLPPSRQGPQLR